jgi:hypothetical protein
MVQRTNSDGLLNHALSGYAVEPCLEWIHFNSDGHGVCVRMAGLPGYERLQGSTDCVSSCVAEPGEWCGANGEDLAGAQYVPTRGPDPVLLVFACPQGFYCPGGRGEGKYPCEASPFNYCPPGCPVATGQPCPPGFACAGAQADKVPCSVAPGKYCPQGAVADPADGKPCPIGLWCEGKQAPAQPCTCIVGRYCPSGLRLTSYFAYHCLNSRANSHARSLMHRFIRYSWCLV